MVEKLKWYSTHQFKKDAKNFPEALYRLIQSRLDKGKKVRIIIENNPDLNEIEVRTYMNYNCSHLDKSEGS